MTSEKINKINKKTTAEREFEIRGFKKSFKKLNFSVTQSTFNKMNTLSL